jgi:hypothetical protein
MIVCLPRKHEALRKKKERKKRERVRIATRQFKALCES